ncbi:sensor histidine kinase [Streptomyces sp. NPDC001404]|uniref:sensor histidine kinase n=1 Tax=Streptomyces sp. NPDC001404 TaxID=3364571 RepID=UPI0036CE1F72
MGIPGGSAPSTRLLLLPGTLGAGLIGLSLWLGLSHGTPLRCFSGVAVGLCFVSAGIAAWRLRPRSRTGPWMALLGLVVLTSHLNDGLMLPTSMSGRELITLFGTPANWLQVPVAELLFLAYPSGRLRTTAERRLVTGAFALGAVAAMVMLATKTPVPICGGWCGPSPLQLVADPQLYLRLRSVFMTGTVVLAAAALALLIRRGIRSTPRQRRLLRLITLAAGLTVLLFAATQLFIVAVYTGRTGITPTVFLFETLTSWLAAITLPLAFLAGLLRQRLAFASVGTLVGRLEHVAANTVEAALAETLRDPTLRVAFPTEQGWIDVSGHLFHPPSDGSQLLTPLGDPPVAVLVHDPSLSEDRQLLDAAATAVRLSLENARLHAQVQAQLTEVRASRQRIATAADTERQRLERDLHDGAQQRLLGIGLTLGLLRNRVRGTTGRRLVDELERELCTAIGELRDLAHGIRPAVLTDQGLAPALAGLARRSGICVHLDVQVTERLDPLVEITAYYVVSEALQNIVKHADRADACVRAVHRAGWLVVEISDEGPGGATTASSSGLSGLADRVTAVGGQLQITSPPCGGTHLRAELPCA